MDEFDWRRQGKARNEGIWEELGFAHTYQDSALNPANASLVA